MKMTLLSSTLVLLALSFGVTPASATSEGMTMSNGKVCRVLFGKAHWHHGFSVAQPSEQAARIKAADRWAGFTRFEYGAAWANLRLAQGASYSCGKGALGWYCHLRAQPCER